jgi:uroporphyrinogen decarboxylase
MTPGEIVREQINHHETPRVPYTLAFEPEVSRRLDEYYGDAGWRDRLTPYIANFGKFAVPPEERIDAVHFRDAFGTVWRTDKLPPYAVEPGLKSPSFRGYAFPSVETFLSPSAKRDAMAFVEESSRSFTIVGTGLCLWQSWYVRGFENTLMDCIVEEGFYAELLDRMTRLTLEIIEKCADIPADALMMGDDWGNQRGVFIGPERWRKLFKPRYARIFEAVHRQGKVAIMHCCGSAADIMADIIEIGLDVLESVQPEAAGMNPYELKKKWGDKITFWGGLGSQTTIPFSSPVEIRREIRNLRREMGKGGGYILAPAKPLRPETPIANAVAVVEEFLA